MRAVVTIAVPVAAARPNVARFQVHFTPMGLAVLVTRAGFEIIRMGQWGNQDYELKLLARGKWLGYPLLAKPVKNDPLHPVGVWTLVRKPP